MASVNKWIGIGNLGADPETRYMPNGDAVANIRIACTESWKDKSTGEKKEVTEWVRIVFYRKLAEIVGQYLKKGASIYVEGKLETRKWQDKDGKDCYTTQVVASEMRMLGGKPAGSGSGSGEYGGGSEGGGGNGSGSSRPQRSQATKGGGAFDDMDDDIPF